MWNIYGCSPVRNDPSLLEPSDLRYALKQRVGGRAPQDNRSSSSAWNQVGDRRMTADQPPTSVTGRLGPRVPHGDDNRNQLPDFSQRPDKGVIMDPLATPRGRFYFLHDNRDDFHQRDSFREGGRGRGVFRGGRGSYRGGGDRFAPYKNVWRGGLRGRGAYRRTDFRRSPEPSWQHDKVDGPVFVVNVLC